VLLEGALLRRRVEQLFVSRRLKAMASELAALNADLLELGASIEKLHAQIIATEQLQAAEVPVEEVEASCDIHGESGPPVSTVHHDPPGISEH
jgi:hypothetical protein